MTFSSYSPSFSKKLASYLPEVITNNSNFELAVASNLEELEELSSLVVCKKRVERLGLDLEPQNLSERLLDLGAGQVLIAGARYRRLNKDFPFIAVEANFSIQHEMLKELSTLLKHEFRTIAPKGFTFNQAPVEISDCEKWTHVLWGKTDFKVEPSLDYRYHFPSTFAHYQEYQSQYQAHLDSHLYLKNLLGIESEEDLQTAASQGLLLEILDKTGNFQGLIAGRDSALFGLDALYIFEIFLSQSVQGKKLAPSFQQHFLGSLQSRFPNVWGNIADENLPSLNTARRCGRKIVQTEFFYNFQGFLKSRPNQSV